MKKTIHFSQLSKLMLAALASAFLFSCSSDEPEPPVYEPQASNIYVVSAGKFKENNAAITAIDVATGKVQENYYHSVNGEPLGDTAMDLLQYGSKVYITVYGSNRIIITDLGLKKIGEINPIEGGQPQSPRYLAAGEGSVYASLYDGHVCRIDTTTLSINAKTKVGDNPEMIVYAKGQLFVANSGGMSVPMGSTLSVLNPKTMEETKHIEVGVNPQRIVLDEDGEYLFVQRSGDYAADPGALMRVNATTHQVDVIPNLLAAFFTINKNELYLISSAYDESWNPTYSYSVIDIKTLKLIEGKKYISDAVVGQIGKLNPQSINYIPELSKLYLGASDYKVEGKMFVVDNKGNLETSFPIAVSPSCTKLIKK